LKSGRLALKADKNKGLIFPVYRLKVNKITGVKLTSTGGEAFMFTVKK